MYAAVNTSNGGGEEGKSHYTSKKLSRNTYEKHTCTSKRLIHCPLLQNKKYNTWNSYLWNIIKIWTSHMPGGCISWYYEYWSKWKKEKKPQNITSLVLLFLASLDSTWFRRAAELIPEPSTPIAGYSSCQVTYTIAYSYKCVQIRRSKRWQGLKEEVRTHHSALWSVIFFQGSSEVKHNQHTASWWRNSWLSWTTTHRSHLLGSVPHHCMCIIFSLLHILFPTLPPVPDGEFSTLHTDTRMLICTAQNTSRGKNHYCNISATGEMPCLVACLRSPVHSLCFASEKCLLGQTLSSPVQQK